MRALVYTRVSTLGQKEGYSLESQKIACQKKAMEIGASEIVYLEDTYTGIELDRPALKELRQLVLSGTINAVIVLDPDRLSRNLSDLLLITNELDRCNVELIFVNFSWESTPLGRLFLELRGAIAEFEHSLIRERTLRGKRQKAINGFIPSFVEPYGYRFDAKNDTLDIKDSEAKIVRYIFAEYNKGFDSGKTLAEKLNKKLISAPGGNRWYASTVLRILSNKTYLGSLVVGGIQIQVPSIITIDDYNRAQMQKLKNTKQAKRRTKHDYLLQNLLVCKKCNSKLKVSTHYVKDKCYSYYTCPKRKQKSCSQKPYSTIELDNIIWQEFIKRYQRKLPEFLLFEKERYQKKLQDSVIEIKRSLMKAERKEKRLLGLVVSGVISEELYRDEQLNVEKNKVSLKEELTSLELELLKPMDNNKFVPLNNSLAVKYRKNAVELFVEKIVIDTSEIVVYAKI